MKTPHNAKLRNFSAEMDGIWGKALKGEMWYESSRYPKKKGEESCVYSYKRGGTRKLRPEEFSVRDIRIDNSEYINSNVVRVPEISTPPPLLFARGKFCQIDGEES